MKKLFAPVLGLLLAAGVFGIDLIPEAFAQNDWANPGDRPTNLSEGTGVFGGSLRLAITTIVNYFLFFLGLVATVMVMYGGFLYITSGGDDSGAEKGKKVLLFASIGLIVILISYALVNTVLDAGSVTEPGKTA